MKYYIRTTHINKIPKKFSDDAKKIWHGTNAGFIGHMLHPYKYMTLDDIDYEICKYNADYPHDSSHYTKEEINIALILLCKFGFAEELK